MPSFAAARRNMVDGQLRTFDVFDRALLAAMDEVPRELFMPAGRSDLAYLDANVTFPGEGGLRVMLAPMVLGRLLQALDLKAGASVLDVGGATGYTAAVLARLGCRVAMLEPRADLREAAARNLAAVGASDRVSLETGGLAEGAPQSGPYDAILVDGAVEGRPATLLGQLVDGGRLACISAGERSGRGTLFVKAGQAMSFRSLFEASAPVLDAFRPAPGFVF